MSSMGWSGGGGVEGWKGGGVAVGGGHSQSKAEPKILDSTVQGRVTLSD